MDVKIKFSNNASARLSNAIDARSTTLNIPMDRMQLFPTLTTGEYFMLTVVDGNGSYEIMKCTARTTTSFTVVRAQEGTKAKIFPEGSLVEHRLTAGSIATLIQQSMATTTNFGLVRIATESEATAGETLGLKPAVITPEMLSKTLAVQIKKATTTVHGIARQATDDEIVSGSTYGNPPAFCTPEGTKKAINTAVSAVMANVNKNYEDLLDKIEQINKEITNIKNDIKDINISIDNFSDIPIGAIVSFKGQIKGDYPIIGGKTDNKWHVCNGRHNTPDLQDKFIVCAGTKFPVDTTGGSLQYTFSFDIEGHALTIEEMPKHTHIPPLYRDFGRGYTDGWGATLYGVPDATYTTTEAGEGKPHTHKATATTKEGEAVPPYYSLVYLIKVL